MGLSALIVTWHDAVRLLLYAAQIIIVLFMGRLIFMRGRWRHPVRNDAVLYIALILLLFTSIRARAQALGTGPFPEGWPTALTVVATLLVMIWLGARLSVVRPRWWPWEGGIRRVRPPRSTPRHGRPQQRSTHGRRTRR